MLLHKQEKKGNDFNGKAGWLDGMLDVGTLEHTNKFVETGISVWLGGVESSESQRQIFVLPLNKNSRNGKT